MIRSRSYVALISPTRRKAPWKLRLATFMCGSDLGSVGANGSKVQCLFHYAPRLIASHAHIGPPLGDNATMNPNTPMPSATGLYCKARTGG